MHILKVSNLNKAYGDIQVLKGISFELLQGEILGVLGPNGAGKTTLINCILGLVTPTSGAIEIFSRDLRSSRSWILQKMNFASNYVSLPLSLTPLENLMVYALMYEVPRPKERSHEVLRLFDLYKYRDVSTRRLSSGQMMRLCLAKAMINDPELLLLDEPMAGLDPEIAHKTRRLFTGLCHERGLSVIYTSHNLNEMEEVSTRVLLLNMGQVQAIGRSDELIERYGVQSLEELFFKVIRSER